MSTQMGSPILQVIDWLFARNRPEIALPLAQENFRSAPHDPEAKMILARCLSQNPADRGLAAALALEATLGNPAETSWAFGAADLLASAGRVLDAEDLIRKRLAQDPDDRNLRLRLAYYNQMRGDFETSKLILDCLQTEDSSPDISFHQGWLQIWNGDIATGYRNHEMLRHNIRWGAYQINWKIPSISETVLARGQKIIVALEGGAGDAFITLSLVATLKKWTQCSVAVACSDHVRDIAALCLDVDEIITYAEASQQSSGAWVAGLDIYKLMGGLQPFPVGPWINLKENLPQDLQHEIQAQKKNFKNLIGLRFSGDPKHELDSLRSLKSTQVEDFISQNPETGFVLLYPSKDLKMPLTAPNVLDFSRHLSSWSLTLALIKELDGVISTCTSVAHAAAALGARTIVWTPRWSYHVWAQQQEENFFYGGHVKVLRQNELHDWSEIFDRTSKELQRWKS